MTPRTRFLKELLLKKKPMICVERAKYWTEAMKETEGEPMIIRNAKALERVLMNISVNIYTGELIVGTMVSDPPGAIVYPEGIGLRPSSAIRIRDHRKQADKSLQDFRRRRKGPKGGGLPLLVG